MTANNQTTTLDFLRHGEVQGGQYYRGKTDDLLTEHGWQQMHGRCEDKEWDLVISSPLKRCADFASDWCKQRQRQLLIDEAWMEMNFGDWEGLSADQIIRRDSTALQAFYADPLGYTPPNAEKYSDFLTRISCGLEGVLSNHVGQQVLIVTHAGVIRGLFSLLLGIPIAQCWQIEVPHACLTRFSCFYDQSGRFIQLNFHNPS